MEKKVDKIDLFYFGVVLFVCAYTFLDSYFFNVYISPDTAAYLREAENLYHGYGYNSNGLAGGEGWFSLFPILHPFMICLFMFLSGTNAYFSSKILSCFCLIVLSLIFRMKFKRKSFYFVAIFLNFGFVWCMFYSWSEIPFILFIVMSVFALNHFLEGKQDFVQCAKILIPCCLAFTTRYYGLFLFFVTLFWIFKLLKNKSLKGGVLLLVVNLLFLVYSFVYMLVNHIMRGFATGGERFIFSEDYWFLTKDLGVALISEIWGFFGNLLHGIVFFKEDLFCPMAILTVVCVLIFVAKIKKNVVNRKIVLSTLSKVFFSAGFLYYVIFIVYRYLSTMDHFFYRFFIPGTILLFVGFVGILENVKIEKFLKTCFGGVFFLIIVSYVILGLTYYKKDGYERLALSWKDSYGWMQPQSKVVFGYSCIGFHPGLIWFRSDMVFFNANDIDFIVDDAIANDKKRNVYVDKKITECEWFSKIDKSMVENLKALPEKSGFWIYNE